ncbi:L-aspartate oxidase [Bacillus marinisedimentorum]|uniref:L-aspartate oxidase n=1 Tax=Bacillus marinisedimentorum TaxID=1821260 RepID=UPI000871EC6E|nr:L-aspartate oxidase [Bacillus marinisedimentorum]
MDRFSDVVIIGSGLAALAAADHLSAHLNVRIITKGARHQSNSMKAQGGVAAAIAGEDDPQAHFDDTMAAGSGFNDSEAVKHLTAKGVELLTEYIKEGLPVDRSSNGEIELGMEGAHTRRRIIHAGGDATGKHFTKWFQQRISGRAAVEENMTAVDLIIEGGRCIGVTAMGKNGRESRYYGQSVLIASGGYGALYAHSSNDLSITGDGAAMAYRAGAALSDMEFVQFHPTMLFAGGKVKGLISEAVRGEGGRLVTESGRRLMKGIHPLLDLAPRDIVAREIFKAERMRERVFLDISQIKEFGKRFPSITGLCESNGVAIGANTRIPVVPGAHFTMGGIEAKTDGRTNIPGLYAVGEAACTGVHGANRLASNSLLEAITFASGFAETVLAETAVKKSSIQFAGPLQREPVNKILLPDKEEIRAVMSKYAGIHRNEIGLRTAKRWFEEIIPDYRSVSLSGLSLSEIEVVNMLTTSWLVVTAALKRNESRGCHFREDFPAPDDKVWKTRHVIFQLEKKGEVVESR